MRLGLILSALFLAIICGGGVLAQSGKPPSKSDVEAEISQVRAELKRKPKSAFLHNQLAALYAALPDLENAQKEIRVAVRLDPRNPIHYVQAASLYRNTGDPRELAMLTSASRLDPNNPAIAFYLGQYCENRGDLKKAKVEFITAKTLLAKADLRGTESTQTKAILPARIVEDVYYDFKGNAYTVKDLAQSIERALQRIGHEK